MCFRSRRDCGYTGEQSDRRAIAIGRKAINRAASGGCAIAIYTAKPPMKQAHFLYMAYQ
jgi:Na+-translocating ferredoxin:NAD+ oxidoreductase RNF subunit RnfB